MGCTFSAASRPKRFLGVYFYGRATRAPGERICTSRNMIKFPEIRGAETEIYFLEIRSQTEEKSIQANPPAAFAHQEPLRTRVLPTRSNPNRLFAAERGRAGFVGDTGSSGRLYSAETAETSMWKEGRGGGGVGRMPEVRCRAVERVRMGCVSEMPSGCGV